MEPFTLGERIPPWASWALRIAAFTFGAYVVALWFPFFFLYVMPTFGPLWVGFATAISIVCVAAFVVGRAGWRALSTGLWFGSVFLIVYLLL